MQRRRAELHQRAGRIAKRREEIATERRNVEQAGAAAGALNVYRRARQMVDSEDWDTKDSAKPPQ